MQFSR